MKEEKLIMISESNLLSLVQQVFQYILELKGNSNRKVWLTQKEAEKMLDLKSSAMANLRNKGLVEYSQPSRKVILYKRESLEDYLEKHSKKPF